MSDEKARILVVDDNETNVDVLVRRLEKKGHEVLSVANGESALQLLNENDIDMVFLDIVMPDISGYDVLDRIKKDERFAHIPVVMVSALDNMNSVVRCIESGADDYLTKPFSPVLLGARLKSCLERKKSHDKEIMYKRKLREYALEVEEKANVKLLRASESTTAHFISFARLAEMKDQYTKYHLERIREYCDLLVRQMAKMAQYKDLIDEKFINNLYTCSPLHDIGKAMIPDEILLKTSRLDEMEIEVMRSHTLVGDELIEELQQTLKDKDLIRMASDIIIGHHEKWNGTGYPSELRGESIALAARIVAVADVYDALVSKRPYKEAYSRDEAGEIIKTGKGIEFDPGVVDAFLEVEDKIWAIREKYSTEDEDDMIENIA